jgi:hypothetical protein
MLRQAGAAVTHEVLPAGHGLSQADLVTCPCGNSGNAVPPIRPRRPVGIGHGGRCRMSAGACRRPTWYGRRRGSPVTPDCGPGRERPADILHRPPVRCQRLTCPCGNSGNAVPPIRPRRPVGIGHGGRCRMIDPGSRMIVHRSRGMDLTANPSVVKILAFALFSLPVFTTDMT